MNWRVISVIIGFLGLLTVGASIAYGARMRGVADTHIAQARVDSILRDSLQTDAVSLRERAEASQRNLIEILRTTDLQRVRDSVALATLRVEEAASQARLDSLLDGEFADLPPEVMRVVQPVIQEYEVRVVNLERQVLEVEGQRDQELERADAALATSIFWMESSLGFETALNVSNQENESLRLALEAQRAALSPSFGFRLKVSWWLLPVGAGLGYLIASK